MKPSSVSAVHDMLASSSALTPVLSSPDFRLVSSSVSGLAGITLPLNIEFQNNFDEGFSNVSVEITDLGPLQVSPNPQVIGNVGAVNAGFTSMDITYPASGGTQTITATMTGELNGDLYSSTVQLDAAWDEVFFNGQG